MISVLVFVMNPAANGFDQTDVSCDLRVIRPDGTQEGRHGLPCLVERANFGGSQNLYRTDMVVQFEGEPADPPGTWTVLAEIKDHVRDTTVKLRTTFVLEDRERRQPSLGSHIDVGLILCGPDVRRLRG